MRGVSAGGYPPVAVASPGEGHRATGGTGVARQAGTGDLGPGREQARRAQARRIGGWPRKEGTPSPLAAFRVASIAYPM